MSASTRLNARRHSLRLLIVAAVLLAGCSRQPRATPTASHKKAPPPVPIQDSAPRDDRGIRFVDIADRSGVRFTYRNGEEADRAAMPESFGGGAALFDYDADGHADLFFPGGGEFGPGDTIRGRSSALFRNTGRGTFLETSRPAGVESAKYYSHGTAVGDFDEDGFADLLVTGYGGLILFHNLGDGTFEEVAHAAGLVAQSFSTSAAWGDLNADGFLDLYVTNYVNWSFENHPYCHAAEANRRDVCNPRDFDPLPDVLYLANGDGTFRDGTQEAGLVAGGKGLGVLLADIDLDGDLDAYVANDTTPNFLYRNDGRGKLTELGISNGAALSEFGTSDGSMGVDVADFDLDGLPDLWVTNYEREALGLYRNEGDFMFQHVSRALGLRAVDMSVIAFGTVFFDMDRDRDEDIFVTNGHVYRFPPGARRKQQAFLLENEAGDRFNNIAPGAGPYFSVPHLGRGAAVGDLDNDGDLDLVVSHTNDPVAVLSNESENRNRWMNVRLIGTRSPRDAVGAVVRLVTSEGEQVHQVKGGTSYLSACDKRLFFGLGSAAIAEQILIQWPSGATDVLTEVPVDRFVTVREGEFPRSE